MNITKRSLLVGGGALAALGAASLLSRRLVHAETTAVARTPSGDLGPFYPVEKPLDTDSDLTRVAGRTGRARGEIIEISGRVLAKDGTPQANARIELWQANAAGRYAHADDDRTDVPLDPAFQGYADLVADAQGFFRFLTVKPGLYPVGSGSFRRAPHIHFDARGRRRRLITQMYSRRRTPRCSPKTSCSSTICGGSRASLPTSSRSGGRVRRRWRRERRTTGSTSCSDD